MPGSTETLDLKDLSAALIDSIDGYRAAARGAVDSRLVETFDELADRREQLLERMQSQVMATGGNPRLHGTIAAMAQRSFRKLRDLVSGEDDAAVLAEVERGEDCLQERFEQVLATEGIAFDVRGILNGIANEIESDRNRIDALRSALRGQS